MKIFAPLWIAIGFFSTLPAPRADWSEKNMKTAICFLPIIGVVIDCFMCLWRVVCAIFYIDFILFSAVAVIIPIAVTGGIHLDGFMDVIDAKASGQPKERKLEIMKDPHSGAFAVIWCAAYLLLSFGLYCSLDDSAGFYAFDNQAVLVICIGFILSRSICALSALALPAAGKNGLLCAFTEHTKTIRPRIALGAVTLLCAGCMCLIDVKSGGLAVFAAFISFLCYRRMVLKQFGGVTGDTCGYFIQICELCILAGAVVGMAM